MRAVQEARGQPEGVYKQYITEGYRSAEMRRLYAVRKNGARRKQDKKGADFPTGAYK